jgi:hypothetical protein
MAKAPKLPDQDDAYAAMVESLAEMLSAWKGSAEPADEFAKRVIGSLQARERFKQHR